MGGATERDRPHSPTPQPRPLAAIGTYHLLLQRLRNQRDAGPVCVFDTAAEAMAFLETLREHARRARPRAA